MEVLECSSPPSSASPAEETTEQTTKVTDSPAALQVFLRIAGEMAIGSPIMMELPTMLMTFTDER
eukprot:2503219-Pyramimonas_sp.AAC.1